MKIALPTNNSKIDDHFGHCEYFTVFTVNDNKEIIAEDIIKPPAGCGCKSNIAQTLSQAGVTVMLAGNMGNGAVSVLKSQGIEVYRGCAGYVKTTVNNWLDGNIVDSGDSCQQHEHECHSH